MCFRGMRMNSQMNRQTDTIGRTLREVELISNYSTVYTITVIRNAESTTAVNSTTRNFHDSIAVEELVQREP